MKFPTDKMRGRARRLRRMATMAHDPQMSEFLTKIAEEIEEDLERLERGRRALDD
jgi:hypothetical protein